MKSFCVIVMLVGLLLLYLIIPVSAMEATTGESHFQLHPIGDLTTLAFSSSLIAVPMILDDNKYWEYPPGSAEDINWLDRSATNNWSPACARLSDFILGGSVLLPLSFTLFDTVHNKHDKDYFLNEAGVFAEALLVTIGTTELCKHIFHRPRPYVYNQQVPCKDKRKTDAYLSFWSGHTAMTACALTSFAYIQMKDNPGKATTKLAVVAALTIIPTEGILRVLAGKHYPSDVLVGAVVGVALGLAVPYLHLRQDNHLNCSDVPSLYGGYNGLGLSISLAF